LSNVLIFPVLPIFVQQLGSLSPDIGISTTLGLVSAIAGLASAISSVLTGRLSDKYGQLVIIVSLAIGAAIFNVLQAFCTDSFQLLITRCLAGFFLGGIMPAANAVIGQVTPRGKRGSAYGFVNMIGSLGLSLGPISGATLAVIINPQAAFLATAVLLLGIALWVGSGPPRQVLAGLRTGQAPARLEEQPAPSQE
jgi:MFS family permease